MLGRKSFLLFISRVLVALLSYVGLLFMLRTYGDSGYGTLSYAMAFVSTFNAFSDMGFSSAHIKRISEGKDLNDCICTYSVIKAGLTLLMVVITLASTYVWTVLLGNGLDDITTEMILIVVLYYVLIDLSSIATNTFTAKMEMVKLPIATLADPLIRVPLVILSCFLGLSLIGLFWMYVISAVGVVIVAAYLLLRGSVTWRHPTLFRSYYKFALPLVLISIIGVLGGTMDRLILGFYYTPDEVAYYYAPQAMLSSFAVIGTAVATLTFPSFSKLHSEGNTAMIRKVTQEAERYILMLSMPISILLLTFPYEMSSILLNEMVEATNIIGIMTVTYLLLMINSVDSTQITAVDRPDVTARISLISFFVTLISLFILVPTSEQSFLGIGLGLSYVGAALALLIGRIVTFIITRYVVWRLTGTIPDKRLALQILAGLAVFLVIYPMSFVLPITRIYIILLYGLISVAVFIGVLYILKEFTRKDLDYFLQLLDIKEMWTYIRTELRSK